MDHENERGFRKSKAHHDEAAEASKRSKQKGQSDRR